MKKSLVLFVSSLVFILLFLSGCGGGGSSSSATSSTTNIIGQATLGPLSNAEIIISDFSGNILGTYKTKASDNDLHEAGQFDINIDSSKLPKIFLISASGGKDIDSLDEGNTNNQIDNNGTIHAIVTKDYLSSGNVIINPLTELLYGLALDKFGDDLTAVKKDDLTDFLDAEAKNYLTSANATYKDILNFNPRLDKATSKIPWQKVLSLVVKGIHKGESSFTIRNKFSIVKTFAKKDGITKSEDNSTFEQLSDDTDGNRVITKIQKDEDNTTVSTFTQKFMTKNGEIIDIFAKKINDEYSYLKATISKDGHEFKIEGKTTLLQGLSFGEDSISNFINSLVYVETQQDGSLKITIDKQLTTRLSDDEVKIYIDGREPGDNELSVITDDPVLNWSLVETINESNIRSTIVKTLNADDNKNITYEVTNNGTIILSMPIDLYDKQMLGINSATVASDIVEGVSNLLIDGAITALGALCSTTAIGTVPCIAITAAGVYSFASDMSYIDDLSDKYMAISGVSSRVTLWGKTNNNGKLILGEAYYPLVYVRNKGNAKTTNLNLYSTYNIKDGWFSSSLQHINISNIGNFSLKKDTGYLILPSKKILLQYFENSNQNEIIASDTLFMKVSSKEIDYATTLTSAVDYSQQFIYSDFTYTYSNNELRLNASSSISPSGTITNYTWKNKNGDILDTGKIITIPYSDLIISGGTTEITLETTSSAGLKGSKTIVISGLSTSNTSILIDEDFESGVLGDKMSISKKGTFNINPSIKNVSALGGNKAFGFGRSTCGANCSTNYQSSLKINFNKTTYVGDISFKVMELYGDWGSLGAIYIDGVKQNLFRQTTNTHNADNQYSNYSYRINKNVNEIELRVWDITNQSELFIDDLKIYNNSTISTTKTDGLQVYYKFENNFNDSARNNITGVEKISHGTFINSPEGKGIKFAGVDNYRIEIEKWQPKNSSFTVSALFKVNSLNDFSTSYQAPIITEQTGDFSNGFVLRLEKENDKVYAVFFIKDSLLNSQKLKYELPSNLFKKWNLLSATVDRNNSKIILYLNGNKVATGSLTVEKLTPEYALIGAYDYKNARNGYPRYVSSSISIDDLRIYNRVLSNTEIKNLFN